MDQELWRLARLRGGKYAVQLQNAAGAWQTLNEFDTFGDAEHSFDALTHPESHRVADVIRVCAVPRATGHE